MSDRTMTILGWLGVLLLVAAAEMVVLRGKLAAFGAVSASSVGRGGTRLLGLLVWMWLGWHLFAR